MTELPEGSAPQIPGIFLNAASPWLPNSACGQRIALQQVADWLQKLGIGQYAQSFPENDTDFSVLPYLTDTDLEKIGVSLGHRRKILAATDFR